MKILFIIGSLRKNSFNRQLANKAKEIIGDRAEVTFLDYSNIPFMNQDLESNLPEVLVNIKEQIRDTDAIWVFTPEYNGMIPGTVKNLFDWLSRPWIPGNFASGTPVKGKPVTISGVGGSNQTKGSRELLDKLLKRIGMKVMSEPSCGFAVPPKEMKSDTWVITEEQIEQLTTQANDFLKFIKNNE